MTALQGLQNGSDIRGVAISTEGFEANLTKKEAMKLGMGILSWLRVEKGIHHRPLKIAIGQDSRISGDLLKEGLMTAFLTEDVFITDTGLSTTPAMFMTTQYDDFEADCGIMLTASHLPYFYNGIKLFTKEGGADYADIAYIIKHSSGLPEGSGVKGKVARHSVIPVYSEDLVGKIRRGTGLEQPLSGFHIVLDAGNGAGGFFAKDVLEALGADTTGSQYLEPDGYFPNHVPNPDNKEAMASIQQAVLAHKADLGVIFDTDVDRAAVVDQTGQVINRNNLIAVLAHIVLEETPGATIVTNSPTSSHLKTFIENLGGKQVRYLCGYKNVINKGIELNDQGISVPLAIETSGHAAFQENYFLDDGAYVIAKILTLLPKLKAKGQLLGDLMSDLKQPAEAQEVRFGIVGDGYRDYGELMIAALHDVVAEQEGFTLDSDNEEGIRVTVSDMFGSGWFLLRMSLHEPLLVLQVENDHPGKNKQVFQTLAPFFEEKERINTEQLQLVLSQ